MLVISTERRQLKWFKKPAVVSDGWGCLKNGIVYVAVEDVWMIRELMDANDVDDVMTMASRVNCGKRSVLV